jgi:hypothetical protein
MGRGSPTSRDLWVWLTFEQDPAGALVTRLAVEEPDRWLVELELSGDALARLFAGESLAVSGEVSGVEYMHAEEPAVELHVIEPEVAPDEAEHEPEDVEEPTPARQRPTADSFTSLPRGRSRSRAARTSRPERP